MAATTPAQTVFFQRVFTASGEHPNFTQRVLYLQEAENLLLYQTFGNLLKTTPDPFLSSGHSLGNFPDSTGINYFRCWSAQAVTYGSNIYITALRFNGSSANGATPETDDEETGANASTKPIKYDAQAGTFSRPIVHPLDGTGVGFPTARACIVKYNRIFAANLYKEGVYRYPSRVYFSADEEAGDFSAERWLTSSYLEVGGDDGSEITSLLPFGEQILIFKNTSVWALTGSQTTTFTLYALDSTIGSEATFGTVAAAGVAYFFDHRSGVWSYDGARFTNISEPINAEIASVVNHIAAFKAVLYYHNQMLYLSIPIGGISTGPSDRNARTYVYDTRLKVWTQWNLGWTGVPSEYFTDYNVSGVGIQSEGNFYTAGTQYLLSDGSTRAQSVGIQKLLVGYADAATEAIRAFFKTSWWNPGDTGNRHRVRRIEAMLTPASVATVDIRRDFDTTIWSTDAVDSAATAREEVHYSDPGRDKGVWQWLQVHVFDNTVSRFFESNGLAAVISDRPRLRGYINKLAGHGSP